MFPIFWIDSAYAAKFGLTIYLVVGLTLTLLSGFPIYKLCIKNDVKNAFLSFVPLAQLLPLGMLIGKVEIVDLELFDADYILIGIVIGCIILGYIPYIGFFFKIIQYIVFALLAMIIIGKVNDSWQTMGVVAVICLFINYLFVGVLWYYYITINKKDTAKELG